MKYNTSNVSKHNLDLKRRYGRFRVADTEITDAAVQTTFDYMRRFLVVEARYDHCWQAIEYLALSPLFDVLPEGCEAPEYHIDIIMMDTEVIDVRATKVGL